MVLYHSVDGGQSAGGGKVTTVGVVVGSPLVVVITVVVVVFIVVTVILGVVVGAVRVIGVGHPTRIEKVRLKYNIIFNHATKMTKTPCG